MTARIILLTAALAGTVFAAPGDPISAFAPELRAEGTPSVVTVAEDGRILVGGGFDAVDGAEVSDRVLLGPDGEVAGEPVPAWLDRERGSLWVAAGASVLPAVLPFSEAGWFPLATGEWLVEAPGGGWLRSADGSPAFPDLAEGEQIAPLFGSGGRLWVLRTDADGVRTLEARDAASGAVDPAFAQGENWPGDPLGAAPGPGESVWVLGGAPYPSLALPGGSDEGRRVFRVDGSGALDEGFAPLELPEGQPAWLSAGREGGFRLTLERFDGWFWPGPSQVHYRVKWHSPEAVPLRERVMSAPAFSSPSSMFAEDGEGNLLVRGANGTLRKYLSDGTEDETFRSPGKVSSVRALPGGKWLVDGKRRLLADGSPDETWSVPGFEKPAAISSLQRFSDGRVLAVGDFFSVDGAARRSLAVFRADGSLDGDFMPDARLGAVLSAALSGGRVFAVTREPVEWGDEVRSQLVKLKADGSLDEGFVPRTGGYPMIWPSYQSVARVHPHVDGGVLVETYSSGSASSWSLARLKANGEFDAGFTGVTRWANYQPPVVLSDGRFVVGPAMHAADGRLLREVGGALPLRPLCEWQGGVLFLEGFHGGGAHTRARLRLWRGAAWTPVAAAPVTDGTGVMATAGGDGSLYLHAAFPGEEGAVLRRIGWIGRTDAAFETAPLILRPRREAREWLASGQSGFEVFDPGEREMAGLGLASMLWDPMGEKLWIGGSFNRVAGEDRDGLAWLDGSGAEADGERPDAYEAWEAGFGLPVGSADGDEDGDGVPNGIEFVMGTDPWTRSAGPAAEVGEDGEIVFRYSRSAEASSHAPAVEFSSDLMNWTRATGMNSTTRVNDGTGDTKEIAVAIPRGAGGRTFVRLRVDL